MPASSDDLKQPDTGERRTAALLNFAGQLEEAFARGEERGRARGWDECVQFYGLAVPRRRGGAHRKRHLRAVPPLLAGTAVAVSAAAARHSVITATAASLTVAASVGGYVAMSPGGGVGAHPAVPASSAVGAGWADPAAVRLAPPPVLRAGQVPAAVSVNSAAPVPPFPFPVPVSLPAAPVSPLPAPSTPATPDTPSAQPPAPVPVVASTADPAATWERHRVDDVGQAVDGTDGPVAYRGHHRRDLPVPVPSALPVPVPSVSLPLALGGG